MNNVRSVTALQNRPLSLANRLCLLTLSQKKHALFGPRQLKSVKALLGEINNTLLAIADRGRQNIADLQIPIMKQRTSDCHATVTSLESFLKEFQQKLNSDEHYASTGGLMQVLGKFNSNFDQAREVLGGPSEVTIDVSAPVDLRTVMRTSEPEAAVETAVAPLPEAVPVRVSSAGVTPLPVTDDLDSVPITYERKRDFVRATGFFNGFPRHRKIAQILTRRQLHAVEAILCLASPVVGSEQSIPTNYLLDYLFATLQVKDNLPKFLEAALELHRINGLLKLLLRITHRNITDKQERAQSDINGAINELILASTIKKLSQGTVQELGKVVGSVSYEGIILDTSRVVVVEKKGPRIEALEADIWHANGTVDEIKYSFFHMSLARMGRAIKFKNQALKLAQALRDHQVKKVRYFFVTPMVEKDLQDFLFETFKDVGVEVYRLDSIDDEKPKLRMNIVAADKVATSTGQAPDGWQGNGWVKAVKHTGAWTNKHKDKNVIRNHPKIVRDNLCNINWTLLFNVLFVDVAKSVGAEHDVAQELFMYKEMDPAEMTEDDVVQISLTLEAAMVIIESAGAK